MRKLMMVVVALGTLVSLLGMPVAAAEPTGSRTFWVPATAGGGTEPLGGTPWVETGMTLKAGMPVLVTVSGQWQSCPESRCTTTANGLDVRKVWDCPFIAPEVPIFSLIGQVGERDPAFVGKGPTRVGGSGALRFAINDCYFGDNVGGFTVTITYACAAAADDNTYACA